MDDDLIDKSEKIVEILVGDHKGTPEGCGQVLMAVNAFIVELIRKANS
jgi:hypothetical protein